MMAEINWRKGLVLLLLGVLLFAGQVWAVHQFLIVPSNIGFNDFYSRWAGARVLLLEGQDPYALEVTERIQIEMGATHQAEGRSGFHYPLHVIFFFLPLVNVPYDWTQAVWFTMLLWVTIGIAVTSLAQFRWRPSPLAAVGLLLAAILFYPAARTMLLGQFTLHVTLFVVLALWALHNGRDGWAGVFLAFTSIKPQMVVAVGVFLVLWTLWRRRYRFVGGVLAGGGGLLLASLLIYPRWVLSFWEDVQRYADVAGGRNPLLVLGDLLGWGGDGLRLVLSVLLVGAAGWAWWRALRGGGQTADWRFDLAVYWTIVVSLLVPFQTGTTNQALLLIPLFAGLYAAQKRWGGWATAVGTALVLVGMWVLFITTISGDYENQIMFLPLPLLALGGLIVAEWHYFQQRQVVGA